MRHAGTGDGRRRGRCRRNRGHCRQDRECGRRAGRVQKMPVHFPHPGRRHAGRGDVTAYMGTSDRQPGSFLRITYTSPTSS